MKNGSKIKHIAVCGLTLSMLATAAACANDPAGSNSITEEPPVQSETGNETIDHEVAKLDIKELSFAASQSKEGTIPIVIGTTFQLPLQAKQSDGSVQTLSASNELDQITFSSSQPSWAVIDENGRLTVTDQAEIGSHATITASFGDLNTSLNIIVIYNPEETIETVAGNEIPVVTNPTSMAVMVNKQRSLPAGYTPEDLVIPDVPFFIKGPDEKMNMRKPAAEALEKMFAAAAKDDIQLVAVSGYRSYERQKTIFEYNVSTQGEEEARRFSAAPGTSEHQTGLTMDISSKEFGNQLEQEFGDTEAGKWVAEHCHEFGFIIRYPEGKEEITGYAYEPWHLRYVGEPLAESIAESGLTMEEYFSESIPVAN